ncbi:hypothetical protein ILUMI_06556 [Ignelater luminosus]|uniref:Uncharacterized protein n=1 Tax=Ignelater luminosus TaxID=2038154 RepID=A0A8K0DFA1_IGNLU|nr:hypothetical protein ILUMI_06556 [Ignelater luminosus]
MYVRRARMEDQASASSGYMYHSDSNGPTSYVHFSGTSGDLSHFGYPPMAISHYTQEIPEAHESFEHYYPDYHHSDYYFNPYSHLHHGLFDDFDIDKYGYGYGYGKELDDFKYGKGDGEKYDTSKYFDGGEKGQSGYKSNEEYEKGSKGKHDKEAHKGYYSKKGGDKEGHHESSEHYGSKNEAAKGSKGESFSESSGHKKGSKTTGYHKVYHKDEYKKDHSFYDESDKRGHHDKYGNADSHHSSENGAFEKGGHSAAGFHENEQGKKGAFDKGYYDVNDSKFLGQTGGNKYHQHHSEIGKDGGEAIKKWFGY